MGDLSEIIKNRRSIRRYQDKEIPEEIVDKLIESLIWAPSAGNLQSRKFHFVFNKKTREELMKTTTFRQRFVSQAPLSVVCSTDAGIVKVYGEKGEKLFSICDVSASIQNLLLTAHNEGLGSCWVGAFDEKGVKEILGIPDAVRVVVLLPVGYPDEAPSMPVRKSRAEIFVSDKWH